MSISQVTSNKHNPITKRQGYYDTEIPSVEVYITTPTEHGCGFTKRKRISFCPNKSLNVEIEHESTTKMTICDAGSGLAVHHISGYVSDRTVFISQFPTAESNREQRLKEKRERKYNLNVY